MLRFAVWRFLLALPSLAGLLVLVFMLVRVLPADPAQAIAGDTASPQQVEEIRQRYGFDKPLPEQFWRYLGQMARADLGTSLFTSRPVIDDLAERLPATLSITLVALALAIGVGVPLGAWAAAAPNRPIDVVVRFLTVGGLAVASFWFAILLQFLFSMELDLLPLSGELDTGTRPPVFRGQVWHGEHALHLFLLGVDRPDAREIENRAAGHREPRGLTVGFGGINRGLCDLRGCHRHRRVAAGRVRRARDGA